MLARGQYDDQWASFTVAYAENFHWRVSFSGR